jgi:hypothetical protein
MNSTTKCLLPLLAVSMLLSAPASSGESKNIADYTLRVHIYSKDSTTFYSGRIVEESKGEGRGNIFDGDDVHGADFNFACEEKLKASFGSETYRAKWKKPGKELTVLLPIFGQTNSFFTCELKTDLKDFVYTRHNGKMSSESEAKYKRWMAKHQYDPVHGKDMPTNADPADPESVRDDSPPQ